MDTSEDLNPAGWTCPDGSSGAWEVLAGSSEDMSEDDRLDTARDHLHSVAGDEAISYRQRIIDLMERHDDLAHRSCRPGHLTGSAMVIDPSRPAALLLFHTKLQKWLQPGGHADGDTNLARVALREAEEETGISGLRVVVPAIDIDIHEVDPPKEDAHLHLDVRYLVLAPPGSVPEGNHESEDLRWVPLQDLGSFGADEGLLRLAAAGFKVAADLAASPTAPEQFSNQTGLSSYED